MGFRGWFGQAGVVGLLAVVGSVTVRAAEPRPETRHECISPAGMQIDDLLRLNRCELEALYRTGVARPIPPGYLAGKAFPKAGRILAVPASNVTSALWQGKYLHADDTMINRVLGLKLIPGVVGEGESWLDGGPAVTITYKPISLLGYRVRDEIREIAPGLYLGIMYRCRKYGPEFVMYFALQLDCCSK